MAKVISEEISTLKPTVREEHEKKMSRVPLPTPGYVAYAGSGWKGKKRKNDSLETQSFANNFTSTPQAARPSVQTSTPAVWRPRIK